MLDTYLVLKRSFGVILYFYYTIFQGEILSFFLHYIYLTATLTVYFADKDFTYKINAVIK